MIERTAKTGINILYIYCRVFLKNIERPRRKLNKLSRNVLFLKISSSGITGFSNRLSGSPTCFETPYFLKRKSAFSYTSGMVREKHYIYL